MAEKEEKLQKLYMEFQMLEHHIKQLEKQSNALNNQLMELMVTNQSLDEIKKVKKEVEILVPISSGIYAKAGLKDISNFIVNVGSNVTLVKDMASTKKLIESQMDEIKKLQVNISNEMQVHSQKAAVLESEINNIASNMKGNP
jgi:prefoldin alpha subunit